ncbi:MAG: ester cyclase [Actinomycetia bacterium]|nr:ester cyclase [Actinomycetes bacterium]
MPTEDKSGLSRQALELWASQSTAATGEVFGPGYVNHQEPDVKGEVSDQDLAEYEELLAGYHSAFSESEVTVVMQVAEGDLVASRWSFTATNTGDYLGRPATGVRATWTGIQIDRHEGGRIVESWVDWDKFRLLAQLGFVEQP